MGGGDDDGPVAASAPTLSEAPACKSQRSSARLQPPPPPSLVLLSTAALDLAWVWAGVVGSSSRKDSSNDGSTVAGTALDRKRWRPNDTWI